MAGYSEEIMNEAKSVIMPKAKTGDESESENSDSDDENSDESSDAEKVDIKGKKKSKDIKKGNGFKIAKPIKVKDRRWIL
jgi:hypothetical protein